MPRSTTKLVMVPENPALRNTPLDTKLALPSMAERAHPEDPGFRDKWFGLRRNPYRQKLFERYRFCNKFVRGKRVADVPCGSGWGTSLLNGYSHITGLDIAEEAIEFAKARYERPDERVFQVGSMANLPFAKCELDVLICLEGFEHVERDTGTVFLEEAKRVLVRDGLLIMTCPVLDECGEETDNPYHLCEYPEEELIDKLNRGFRILSIERVPGPDGPEYRTVVANLAGPRYRAR